MANILTSIRIICGLLILIFPAFSDWYYLLYLIGSFTDAIDGITARKLGRDTPFGAKFDTIADFIFVLAVIIKLVKSVFVPMWLFLWICVIFSAKVAILVVGVIRYKRFVTVHSKINKACGVIVYITLPIIGSGYVWQVKALVVILVCLFASAAAIDECTKVLKGISVE